MYFFIYSININICLAVYQNHNRVKTGIWYPSKDCFSQHSFPLGVVTWLRSINSMWMERIFATCLTKRKPLTLGLHSVTYSLEWGCQDDLGSHVFITAWLPPASVTQGFPRGSASEDSTWPWRRLGFHPWVREIPWKREWLPSPVILPGEFCGQRSLAGYMVRGITKCWTWLSD